MTPESTSSLSVYALVMLVSVVLILIGRSLRNSKSSRGISASSNDTSTGTAFMVVGALLFLSYLYKFVQGLL